VTAGFDVVIPSAGRESLGRLLGALGVGDGPFPERVLVVDDRPPTGVLPLALGSAGPAIADRLEIVRGRARGPAAARNAGWRRARAEWVAFLDDDVEPQPGWRAALARDLDGLAPPVAGSQGRVTVPLPDGRPATDWERNTAGLEQARWATADIAYRRSALMVVGGFDERFRRAYREDTDLGLRLVRRGYEIGWGSRRVLHPVRPADRWASLRAQAGNGDDALMRRLHGRRWREQAGAPRGRLRRHLAVTAAGVAGAGAAAAGRRRAAAAAFAVWLAGSAELAWARAAPGPRTREELTTVLATSALMPPVAAFHWARGHLAARRQAGVPGRGVPEAVLFDRDGTLIEDVPYNADPGRVRPMPGARRALDRLRSEGVGVALVSNQSGVGRGLVSQEQVAAVNRRVEELLGPLGPALYCPHAPDDGCDCRKPQPGLVLRAAARLGVDPHRCALIGDIGSDVEAARAAGARPVLVPTPRTRPEEVAAAPEIAPDLESAVQLLLGEPAG
jgi:histidinol-phosphate phosphatase family protein